MIEKKPIKIIFYLFISIFTFSSCSRYVETKVSDKNLNIPIGTFSNYSVDTSGGGKSFWKEINPKDSLPYYFNKSALIRIEKSSKNM